MTDDTTADSISMAPDLKTLLFVLSSLSTSDIVVSEKTRIALRLRANDIIVLSRRAQLEGHSTEELHWITSYPEFLLENEVQQDIRCTRLGRIVFDDFVRILNSEKRSVVEYKEVLRTLGTIPGISDIAWDELYNSPLMGLSSAIESEEGIARLMALAMKISTLVLNDSILRAINSRAEEIVDALEGKRNPDLLRNLSASLILTPSSPWMLKKQRRSKKRKLDSRIVDAILLRAIKDIPEIEDLHNLAIDNPVRFRQSLERMIDRMGWPFVRSYLIYLASMDSKRSFWMDRIADTMRPLGSPNIAVLYRSLDQKIPIPYQIIKSTLGTPVEYILSHDVLEQEQMINGFKSDRLELDAMIDPMQLGPQHFENVRTGVRMDEALVGKESLIRNLYEMKSDQSIEAAKSFVDSLLVSPNHPSKVKKVAVEWIRLFEG
ncbi:MAG: hypothetical protein ACFFF4_02130 [Candidatus Thorarchaeota archaeon]